MWSLFHHIFKNIHCYVLCKVYHSKGFIFLYYFDDGLTLKTLKLAYIGFCIQTLHTDRTTYDKIYKGPRYPV